MSFPGWRGRFFCNVHFEKSKSAFMRSLEISISLLNISEKFVVEGFQNCIVKSQCKDKYSCNNHSITIQHSNTTPFLFNVNEVLKDEHMS